MTNKTENERQLISIKQAIGERIMPRLEVDAYIEDSSVRARVWDWISEHKVGGFCIFGGDGARVLQVTTELQKLSLQSTGIPLLFSADCEWGLPMRLRNTGTEFPDAMAIAHCDDLELTFEIGRAIAEEMRALGILWNFAPVSDVNSNPRNPIINTRAFSDKPNEAAAQSVRMLQGIESQFVAATAKHFPGHGDTLVDSHTGLPSLTGGLAEFERREFIPFRAAIKAGVRSIMLGHIAVPKLAEELGAKADERDLPATLSRAIVHTLLRERMGFAGIIVSDSLEMQSISDRFGSGEAAVRAVKAGIDVVLMPIDVDESYAALVAAAERGEFDADELRASHDRIRNLKKWVAGEGLKSASQSGIPNLAQHKALAERAAAQALEIKGNLAALSALTEAVVLTDDRAATIQRAELFSAMLRERGIVRSVQMYNVTSVPESLKLTATSLLVSFHRARGYLGGKAPIVTMPQIFRRIAQRLREDGTEIGALLLFGSPYLEMEFEPTPPMTVVKTFSESYASIEAAIALLSNNS